MLFFFFSSRRRHTRSLCDWSSDVCSSDLDGFFSDVGKHLIKQGTSPWPSRRAVLLGRDQPTAGQLSASGTTRRLPPRFDFTCCTPSPCSLNTSAKRFGRVGGSRLEWRTS